MTRLARIAAGWPPSFSFRGSRLLRTRPRTEAASFVQGLRQAPGSIFISRWDFILPVKKIPRRARMPTISADPGFSKFLGLRHDAHPVSRSPGIRGAGALFQLYGAILTIAFPLHSVQRSPLRNARILIVETMSWPRISPSLTTHPSKKTGSSKGKVFLER